MAAGNVTDRLFELIKVHCCFCPHTVEHDDPQEAHDAMEKHYEAKHSALIGRLVGMLS